MKLTGVTADLLDAIEGLEHGELLQVRFSDRAEPVNMPWAPTFGDVAAGSYLLYEDSYGRLCIAQNQGRRGGVTCSARRFADQGSTRCWAPPRGSGSGPRPAGGLSRGRRRRGADLSMRRGSTPG